MILRSLLTFYLAAASLGVVAPESGGKPESDLANISVELRRFSFEEDEDADFDGQPDDWSRRRGSEFPQYVEGGIDRKVHSHGRQSLRFKANGGPAIYYSQLVPIDGRHAYILRGSIRTEGLQNNAGVVSVSLLNHRRERMKRYFSRPISGTTPDWTPIEIGPIYPDPEVRFLVIGCHLIEGEFGDISGTVWFDDLWLGCLPRLAVSTSSANHFFKPGEPIEVATLAQGVDPRHDHHLQLRLYNEANDLIGEHELPLAASPDGSSHDFPSPILWNVEPQRCGWYRITAALRQNGKLFLLRKAHFVVLEPVDKPSRGEFGWSIPRPPAELSGTLLAEMASQSGLRWMKYPMWRTADPQHAPESTEIMRLLERLDHHNIRVIGLLNDAPETLRRKFAYDRVGVGQIFTLKPEVWYPSIEPVLARYSFHVRHWQLGDESDASFVGISNLGQVLSAVKKQFDQIGRDVDLGMHWDWKQPLPRPGELPRTFYSLSSHPPLPPEALTTALRESRSSGMLRWPLLENLPQGRYSTDERAAALVRKMVAAKLGAADAIFLTDPFDPDRGILLPDGSPTEMFLPWRTAALALAGTTHTGTLSLAGHSANFVFNRPGETVLVLWNETPTEETVYLGEQAEEVDVWGRRRPLGRNQVLHVGPTPIFVRHCNPALVSWQLAVRFDKGEISSEYGGHNDSLLGQNPFPQGVSGTATIHMPREWKIEPSQWTLQLGAGEKFSLPLVLAFPTNSSLGQIDTQIEFEISADRPYRFIVRRPYKVGLGDIVMRVTERRTPDGQLEIEQRIINNTEPLEILNFNCSLSIPGERRQRKLVVKLAKGEDLKFYYLPNADAMQGQELWIRAEQINGRRVLNYRWFVGQ
ncbi:MAG TPA: hypothetical protein VHB77_04575 [Planctomycetaceae bacterium]|nr:hypothetical protein [Planctomycetaceae bacterium]